MQTEISGAIKRGLGTCGTFKPFNLTYQLSPCRYFVHGHILALQDFQPFFNSPEISAFRKGTQKLCRMLKYFILRKSYTLGTF